MQETCLLLESSFPEGPLEVVVQHFGHSYITIAAREVLTDRQRCPECIHQFHRADIWSALQLANGTDDEATVFTKPSYSRRRGNARAHTENDAEAWLGLLDSPCADERILAVEALHERRHLLIPHIVEWLRDPEDAVVLEALHLLELFGGGEVAPVAELKSLLRLGRLRAPVLRALGVVGHVAESALPLIQAEFFSDDPQVRKEALLAYEKIGRRLRRC